MLVELWMNDPMLAAAKGQPRAARRIRGFLRNSVAGILSTPFMGPPDIPLPKLVDLKMPALILVGDRDDPEIVERSRTIAAEIPTARRTIIRGAGHMLNVERPREFNQALAAFLRTVPPGG